MTRLEIGFERRFLFIGDAPQIIFFRAFGAIQRPYFQVTKLNSLRCRLYRDIRSWGGMALRGQW